MFLNQKLRPIVLRKRRGGGRSFLRLGRRNNCRLADNRNTNGRHDAAVRNQSKAESHKVPAYLVLRGRENG